MPNWLRRLRSSAVVSVVVVTTLAFAGCSGGSDDASQPKPPAERPDGSGPAAGGPALASAVGDFPGGRVEIHGLRRSGDALRLDFAVVNDGRELVPLIFSMRDPGFDNDLFADVSGVALLDASGAREYRVLLGADDRSCRCSSGVGHVAPGASTALFAEFPLPPPEVESLDVVVPHYTPMLEVPIGGSGGDADQAAGRTPSPVATTAGTGTVAGVTLEAFDLRRTGEFAILRFGLHNTGSEPFHPNDKFQAPELKTPRIHDFSGVTLRDPPAQKQYLPLRDATGFCLCSGAITFDGPLEAGVTDVFWVGFPAPPPATTSVEVVVPNFPPLTVLTGGEG